MKLPAGRLIAQMSREALSCDLESRVDLQFHFHFHFLFHFHYTSETQKRKPTLALYCIE